VLKYFTWEKMFHAKAAKGKTHKSRKEEGEGAGKRMREGERIRRDECFEPQRRVFLTGRKQFNNI